LTPGGTVSDQLVTEGLQVSGKGNGADGDVSVLPVLPGSLA
jgi:hypothetical protein